MIEVGTKKTDWSRNLKEDTSDGDGQCHGRRTPQHRWTKDDFDEFFFFRVRHKRAYHMNTSLSMSDVPLRTYPWEDHETIHICGQTSSSNSQYKI